MSFWLVSAATAREVSTVSGACAIGLDGAETGSASAGFLGAFLATLFDGSAGQSPVDGMLCPSTTVWLCADISWWKLALSKTMSSTSTGDLCRCRDAEGAE